MMNSNFYSAGKAAMTSNNDCWETPQKLFNKLNAKYHFTLDPCATKDNAKCKKYFTVVDDGLSKSWADEVVFCNPPYGRNIGLWVAKCHRESSNALVVALLPARTDTKYFHEHIYHQAKIIFIKGRLKFELDGKPLNSAPFPSMIVIWGENNE